MHPTCPEGGPSAANSRNVQGASMKRAWHRLLNAAPAIVLLAVAPALADDALRATARQLFGSIEAASRAQQTSPEVDLGRALFWDTRISVDGKTACASCHAAETGGADERRVSVDARGKPTPRNAQTVFNAMAQPMLRWLGDRPNGAVLAEGLATAVIGFASKDDLIAALARHGYADRFNAVYGSDPEPLSAKSYARALAAYQATLTTPAPFDRFLAGDDKALNAQQRAGLKQFIDTGCSACHNGPLLGGTMLHRFGLVKDYAGATASNPADPGRFAITKKEEDRNVFRVSMLRNIAKTAPYFHDGSAATLPAAVRVMADVQLGRQPGDEEVASIVAFLESLSGEVPANYAPPRP
jgi:cytochrome c peroxidase